MKIFYFAYGSNLHPVRLRERVPSASLLGTVGLERCRLMFHKTGGDGSSKCNLVKTGHKDDRIHGAIYTMDAAHKGLLDRFEGKGNGYLDHPLTVSHSGRAYDCFTYLAQDTHIDDNLKPFHWYKQLVLLGARYLQFPDHAVNHISAVDSVSDPDEERRQKHERLIDRIHRHR